jgi:hypothetical protein
MERLMQAVNKPKQPPKKSVSKVETQIEEGEIGSEYSKLVGEYRALSGQTGEDTSKWLVR